MNISTWEYYNHAMIPTQPPTIPADTQAMEQPSFWSGTPSGTPLLARWTEGFDCPEQTGWWYIIKDEPFDISLLKSNYRYKINKGLKYFEVRVIDPKEYAPALYKVQVAAFSAYPAKYRPEVDKGAFLKSIGDGEWDKFVTFAAFHRESGELVGYSLISQPEQCWLELNVQKTMPEYEKFQLNAALVAGVLTHYAAFLEQGGVICDGARSINHETNFQDYLETYFGFRKAYCKLCIAYHPKIKWVIKLLFPVRGALQKLDGIGIVHQVNSVLKMEELSRM